MAPAQPPALRNRVRRAFNHSDMKNVCEQFRRGNINNLPAPTQALINPPLTGDLVIIADAFVELQEARHAADYDAGEFFTRPDVLAKIALVDEAFDAWRRVRRTANANVFLAALLLSRQWRAGT
jgi:hypothetical protein